MLSASCLAFLCQDHHVLAFYPSLWKYLVHSHFCCLFGRFPLRYLFSVVLCTRVEPKFWNFSVVGYIIHVKTGYYKFLGSQKSMQDLHSHFNLSLWVHYGELGGGAYRVGLHILYWMTQQFLYYLSERKFGWDPPLPNFSGLHHVHTKTLDGFLGCLLASWLKQVHPEAHAQANQCTTMPNQEPHPICN